jgi:hypothetical protein
MPPRMNCRKQIGAAGQARGVHDAWQHHLSQFVRRRRNQSEIGQSVMKVSLYVC